tara:strand:+ start:351 stop:749 length:399 start_codon:yes stop_codon:yes gene_type:complete
MEVNADARRRSLQSTPVQIQSSTILLVENEAVIRLMLKEALERMRSRVLEAGDGHEAAEAFRADRDVIDLVLLDLNMPGMDGLEVLISVDEEVKVIIVSANAPPEKSLGYTAFVTKPYQLSQLLEKIECVLA